MAQKPIDVQAYIASKIGTKNVKDFELWAFGEEFALEESAWEMTKLWNREHYTLPVYPTNGIRLCLDHMVELWERKNENGR